MEESSWCSHPQSVIRRQIWCIGRQIISSMGIHNIHRIVNFSKSFCVQCFSWRVSLKNPEKSEFQIGKKSPIHTIRKVKFLSKNSILTKLYNFLGKSKLSTTKKCETPTFSRVFHPNFFWQFFLWNQSCQQLKSPKPQHLHEFLTPKKSTIFSGNQSWIFGQRMKISNSVLYIFFISK